jgi:formylglycine-generating enzyme required for sulfatase activity
MSIAWPMSQDYNEAIQAPAHNFADTELKQGEAVTNPLGIPLPCSGTFADVYQVRCPSGARWAVKCFTRAAPGLRERYQEIGRHRLRAKLPFMVDFSYLEQGIRVAGRWYPVLKMDWVEGLTLSQFAAQYADKPAMLEALLHIWRRMARRLRAAGIAHCDLQHGNVLLVPDAGANSLALRLIDYDGMFVPALAGNPSCEVGHASYQHPQRLREGTYSLEVDRFPLLLIATALSALKAGGRALWEKYNNGDNLLFRQSDLEAPTKSVLFYELLNEDDPLVRFLAENLIDAARKPLVQTPLLEELISDARSSPVSGDGKETPPAVAAAPEVPPETEFASLQPDGEPEPRQRIIAPLWIASAVAVALLGVFVGVIALVANHGDGDSKKGQALARGASDRTRTQPGEPGGSLGGRTETPAVAAPPAVPESDRGPRGNTRVDKTILKPPERGPDNEDDDDGRHGEHEIKNSIHMKLVLIPAGRFLMGSPPEEKDRVGNEGPRHTVEISRPFYMGVYPVTQDEYQKVVGINPSYFSPSGGGKDKVAGLDTRRFPVEQVSWNEAVAFCEKLSGLEREKKAGRVYRLPTEAEWEYACRAGTTTRFFFGERLSAKDANFDATQPYGGVNKEVSYGGGEKGPTLGRTTAVGFYAKNAFGLYDMHGNVYQWCNDWHDEDYFKSSPEKDPPGPEKGASGERSMRGGSFATPAWNCRVTSRSRFGPNIRINGLGFRAVCVARGIPYSSPAGQSAPPPSSEPGSGQPKRAAKEPVGEIRQFVGHVPGGDGVLDVAFAPNGRTAVSGGQDKTVRLWEVETGKEIRRFEGHAARITAVCFTPDGIHVVSASDDKTVRLWEVASSEEIRRFEHPGPVGYHLSVTTDGKRILSESERNVYVWDLKSGKELQSFGFQGIVEGNTGVRAFSTDGRRALSSGDDFNLRLWDVNTGRLLGVLAVQSWGGTFSPDGRFVLSSDRDNYLRLYNAKNGRFIRRFTEEPAGFHGMSFSPDGRRVLTPCERHVGAVLWDVESGKRIYHLAGNPGGISRIVFSPDGRRAISASRDGSVRLWGLPD